MIETSNIPGSIIALLAPYLRSGGEGLGRAVEFKQPADLEISLHRRSENGYSVEMRYTPPGSQIETRLGLDRPLEIQLDQEDFRELALSMDWESYGRKLGEALFAPEAIKLAFGQALARGGGDPLRMRLLVGASAPELHSLYWETMRSPLDGALLAGNQRIYFSRYLPSAGFQQLSLRQKSSMRVLIAVASPEGLENYGLASIDAAAEVRRAEEQLGVTSSGGRLGTSILASEEANCTLANLVRRLQDGVDILYLVAHGSFGRGQAWLWLEDEERQPRRVAVDDLAREFGLLEAPPVLTFLASCESAGKGSGDVLQALGPRLCEAGAPAVIAMQGQISMVSMQRGMPVFFEKLIQDGQVDRALASARANLVAQGAPDFWMPVLFMRLKDGLLWKAPQNDSPATIREMWETIQNQFAGRPAAQGALEDWQADADDPDNQEAFAIQLKKALREDGPFATRLAGLVEEERKRTQSDKPAGINIQVGGNVGGSIVIGNQNTLQQLSD